MSAYTKEQVGNLVDGRLDWDTTVRMLSMPKDHERFSQYSKCSGESLVARQDSLAAWTAPAYRAGREKQTLARQMRLRP